MKTEKDSAPDDPVRSVDDLKWMIALLDAGIPSFYDWAEVAEMLEVYTNNPDEYSDGSPVGTYVLDDKDTKVLTYQALKPPHRRFCFRGPRRNDSL